MSDTRAGIWVDAIPGGYRRIPTVNLCWIWSLHIRGELSRIDIRVWFALHEMAERRCMLDQGRRPRFRLGELVELLGDASEASVRAAVRRLRAAGVCVVSASRIGFPKHTKEQRESVAPMLRRMPRRKAWLHVPRRVVRRLAAGLSRAESAVLLGAVIRCVFFHRPQNQHRIDGRLPARWTAETFQVSERAVIGARKRLVAARWLQELPSPGWSVARFGKRLMLRIGSAAVEVAAAVGSAWVRQTSPLLRRIQQELARSARMGQEGREQRPNRERSPNEHARTRNGPTMAVGGPDPQAAADASRDGSRGDAQRRTAVRATGKGPLRASVQRQGLGRAPAPQAARGPAGLHPPGPLGVRVRRSTVAERKGITDTSPGRGCSAPAADVKNVALSSPGFHLARVDATGNRAGIQPDETPGVPPPGRVTPRLVG